MKNENDFLKSTNTLFEVDGACLTDKISTLVKEVDDLKFTLARIVKGKNTLDTILSMKVNFQKEGLGYTPPTKVTPQKSFNTSHVSKPSSTKYVHVCQKVSSPKLVEHVESYASKKYHVNRNSNVRSMYRISC